MARATEATQYAPDVASPPGETLIDVLDDRHMTQAELAERTGRPLKTINEIVKGKAAITPQTAIQLERVLGIPAHFWLNREARYREHVARIQTDQELDDQADWLDELPVREMQRFGWIDQVRTRRARVAACLSFFGVASVVAWRAVCAQQRAKFRRSSAFTHHEGAVAAWLRKGELEAAAIPCAPLDRERFRSALYDVRALTMVNEPAVFVPRLQAICAASGVAVVLVPTPCGTGASGAVRWLRPDRALIQLSMRYLTDDHLWFTFFHEAGHVLLHGKRPVYLDGDGSEGDEEDQANRFAADLLVPPAATARLANIPKTADAVKAFAREIGVAPGIVVGRMQHDGLVPYRTKLNALKVRYAWTMAASG